MRSLKRAKRRARFCREEFGDCDDLLQKLREHLWEEHGLQPSAVHPALLDGSRAEIKPPRIRYDESLDERPDQLLLLLAHELGHLELHERVSTSEDAPSRRSAEVHPIYGSVYLSRDDTAAVARYSNRSREEAEAIAFATEFVCPSDEAFRRWRDAGESPSDLANAFHVSQAVVRTQLADALFDEAVGSAGETPPEAESVPTDSLHEKGQSQRNQKLGCNERQEAAATHTGSPALVNAGPGTGKTRTLVRRAQHLISEQSVPPQHLTVLTFSNEATGELETRLAAALGEDVVAEATVATFHGFGFELLRQFGHRIEVSEEAVLMDDAAQTELLLEIIGAPETRPILKLRDLEDTAEEARRHIDYLKQRLITPADLAGEIGRLEEKLSGEELAEMRAFQSLFERYETEKASRGRLDFTDLIGLPTHLLQTDEEAASLCRRQYRWLLIDEFQDVSSGVRAFLEALAGPDNQPWVVGDARQAIFRFLSADPENVSAFADHFADAERFELERNYRSCLEVVQCANQLATLLEDESHEGNGCDERWTSSSDASALFTPAVELREGISDRSEREGIAGQVAAWIREEDIPPHDIAVLARRNVDVRNIALALSERGIPTTTSSMVTPEGAAGDLAAAVTLTDRPAPSVAPLAFALGEGEFEPNEINQVTGDLLDILQKGDTSFPEDVSHPLAEEVAQVWRALHRKKFAADAFTAMCIFLFEASDYLRRLLARPTGAERDLQLVEIVTALTRAAGYRISHPDLAPQEARLAFGDYFRRNLSSARTSAAPKRTEGAVQVMTCHAAKGLEFPHVIVAGQSYGRKSKREYDWIPDTLDRSALENKEQADALLFVGATRAEQTLVISYALSKSGTEGALAHWRQRNPPEVLQRWQEQFDPAFSCWPNRVDPGEEVETDMIWGGQPKSSVSTRALKDTRCMIKTYLSDFRHLRFPEQESPVYPKFFVAVRETIDQIVRLAHREGRKVSESEASRALEERWAPVVEALTDHAHEPLFRHVAERAASGFAAEYAPLADQHTPLDLKVVRKGSGESPALRLGLASHFYDRDERPVALLFRPESLQGKLSKRTGNIKWSGLESHRLPFVLLREHFGETFRPLVYSGTDGRIYDFDWSTRGDSLPKEIAKISERRQLLDERRFQNNVEEYWCDQCDHRLMCPYWLGALG